MFDPEIDGMQLQNVLASEHRSPISTGESTMRCRSHAIPVPNVSLKQVVIGICRHFMYAGGFPCGTLQANRIDP